MSATPLSKPLFHLTIAQACAPSPTHTAALKAALQSSQTALPNLQQLLMHLQAAPLQAFDEWLWSTPAELAHARALGLVSGEDWASRAANGAGLMPWAAWQLAASAGAAVNTNIELKALATRGHALAWVSPCQWLVGIDRMTLQDPADLQLGEDESRAFCDVLAPWFTDMGVHLQFYAADRWLASGEALRHLPCASLHRAVGRSLDPWLPSTGEAVGKQIRRLQNEMQMLLYTHPLNDSRQARGLPTVNAFWLHGAGALSPEAFAQAEQSTASAHLDESLHSSACLHDPAAWLAAWQALDAGLIAKALAHAQAGGEVRLNLCGENHCQTWRNAHATTKPGVLTRLARWVRTVSPQALVTSALLPKALPQDAAGA